MKKQLQALCLLILSLMSSLAIAQIPKNGLLVYYPFDNNTNDYSGHDYNATTNNTAYIYIGPNNDDYSIYNTSNIGETYYNFASQANDFKSQSYSTMMWVNLANIPATYANLLELGSQSTTSHYFRFLRSGSTYFLQAGHYNVSSLNGNNLQYEFPNSPVGQWIMLGVTSSYDAMTGNRTINIYKDGVVVDYYTFNQNTVIDYDPNYSLLNIAHRDGAANMFLDGKIEDFTYYNRAITSQEAMDYYNACPFVSSVKLSGPTLYANTKPGLSYQWIDCANNLPIAGETAATFTPTFNGNYKVQYSYLYGTTNCSAQSNCESVTAGGVAPATELFYYPFDGQTLINNVNSSETLVANQGATQYTTSTSTGGGTHALITDGNQYYSAPFTMPAVTGFTLSMWVNRPVASNDYDILAAHLKRVTNTYPGTFSTGIDPLGKPFMEVYSSSSSANTIISTYTLSNAMWHHLTFQWKSTGKAYIYINGVLNDSITCTTILNPSANADFSVGAMPNNSFGVPGFQSMYAGHIDEIRLFDKALTPTEVFDLYSNVTSIYNAENQKTVAHLFPNPASTILNILLNTQGETAIEIYDLTGKQLKSTIAFDAQSQINIEDLNAGVYVVKIINGTEMQTAKFVKE